MPLGDWFLGDNPLGVDRYYFSTGISAFFEMPTTDAVVILPPHLQPIEVRHQRSVLAVTAFHFRDSEVGAYVELMFSIVVPPVVAGWAEHPKAGFYPFMAGTSSEASRRIRTERLRIPHHPENLDAQFVERAGSLRVRAWSGGKPVVDLSVTQHRWEQNSHLLHAFMMDGSQRLKASCRISGRYTVHENEGGRMTLFDHPMTKGLTRDEVSPYPFREHWLKEGCELFHPVEVL